MVNLIPALGYRCRYHAYERMPTIEIVSIDAKGMVSLPDYAGFSIITEQHVVSHRDLFQRYFDQINGVIVHVGNRDLGNAEGAFFASDLLIPRNDSKLVFKTEIALQLRDLIDRLILHSPRRRVTFSTDYQFGGDRKLCEDLISVQDFWVLHEAHELQFNTLWNIENA